MIFLKQISTLAGEKRVFFDEKTHLEERVTSLETDLQLKTTELTTNIEAMSSQKVNYVFRVLMWCNFTL